MGKGEKERISILNEAIKIAAFEGWNDQTLEKALLEAGFSQDTCYYYFPAGIPNLIDLHAEWSNEEMLKELARLDLNNMRIRDKIAAIVMTKIEIHTKNKEALRKLLTYYTMPQHSFQGLRHLARTVSLMWYEAGDTSSDFNYYTKRALLSGVLTSTMIYWLNDNSQNHQKTRIFLNNRIENVMKVQKIRTRAENIVNNIPFIRKVFY